MNTIDQFVDKLIEEKGINGEPAEVMAQIKADLMDRIETRINAMVIENLDESDFPAFQKLLDADNSDAVQTFIKSHIPDIDEKVALELLTFKTIYLG